MKSSLIKPSDLLTVDAEEEDIQGRVTKLQATAVVLQQSISAQQEVAKHFESQPQLYGSAVRIIQGLVDAYAQTLLQAALLDLQIVLGSEMQVALFVTQMAQQVKSNNQKPIQVGQQNAAGTSIAEPPSKDEETVDEEKKDNEKIM